MHSLSLLIHMVTHAWFPKLCYYPRKCLDNQFSIEHWWVFLQFANWIHALDCISISPAQRCLCLDLRVSSETCLLTFLSHCRVVTVRAGWCECLKGSQGSFYQSALFIRSPAVQGNRSSAHLASDGFGIWREMPNAQWAHRMRKMRELGDHQSDWGSICHYLWVMREEMLGRSHKGFQLPQLSAPLCISTGFELRLWAPTA